MAGDMLTQLWEQKEEKKHMTWKDMEQVKWKKQAEGCPAKMPLSGICRVSCGGCEFKFCFARHWGIL